MTARERVSRVKLDAPRLPAGHLSRPRLVERLDGATAGQVVLISAPAGYGKTMLLADWVGGRRSHTAWVSLSAADDDRRFWSAVLAALTACPAVPGTSRLHTLAVPAYPSGDADFVARVSDGLGALPEPITLVLDDIHELVGAPIRGLTSLVRDRPRDVRIVLSGRADPLLPLGRLRASEWLCEVRAEHLRFTVDEATGMLARTGVVLDPELVALLVEQTGGWAAGVRLAAPSLQNAEDPGRFLRDLVGSGRVLSDYLVGEVLDGLTVPVRDLLDAVSICADVTAPLAAAVSEMPDAGDLLDRLEHETGLVVSSGSGRVRYTVQPLLRAHLQVDLRRRRPGAVTGFHARAAQWFADQQRPALALEHARAADRPGMVVDLLRRDGVRLLASGRHAALRAAVGDLDEDVTAADPWLSLIAALAHLEVGELTAADRHLGHADLAWPAEPAADLVALRRVSHSRRGALSLHPDIADGTPTGVVAGAEERLGLTPFALIERGYVALVTRRPEAAQELAEAALSQADGHAYLAAQCYVLLAGVAAEMGDYPRMGVLAELADANAGVPEADEASTRATALAAVFRSYRALLLSRPVECLDLARPATAFIRALGTGAPDELTTVVGAIRGAAMVDGGDHIGGLATLEAARRGAGNTSARTVVLLAMLEHHAATALGFTDRARASLAWATDSLGVEREDADGEMALLRAHHQFQLGRGTAAAALLAPVLDGSVEVRVPWTVPEAWVLRCRLALQAADRAQALDALGRAVRTSTALDVLRPLVLAPAEVIGLLVPGRDALVGRVTEARRSLAGGLPVALTDRERTVLRLLMTQQSIGEIATDLTLSANTVKTHVRAIYTKLGVRTRREAIIAARERRLPGSLTM